MIYINEFLPNPAGSDANEWIELFNNGKSSASISGWYFQTSSGKKTFLSGAIAPGEYKVFYKKDYKFALRNTDENIILYDANGARVDSAGFTGQAISGKSYSRQVSENFIVADPTPGLKNIEAPAISLINHSFPYNQSLLLSTISTGQILILCIAAGVLSAGISLYSIKNHENLSNLFFGRDEKVGE